MKNVKQVVVHSSLYLPISESGHIFYCPRPCVLTGVYSETTGTILLESIICDGTHFEPNEIDPVDLRKFQDELRAAVMSLDF